MPKNEDPIREYQVYFFPWKCALGISRAKYRVARKTGIPTTKPGIQRKVGRGIILGLFFPFKRER